MVDQREALRLWTHGKSRPKACDSLFSMIQKRGWITKEVRLRRIQKALKGRQLQLAHWLAKPLEKSEKEHVSAWDIARRKPVTMMG